MSWGDLGSENQGGGQLFALLVAHRRWGMQPWASTVSHYYHDEAGDSQEGGNSRGAPGLR